MSIPNYEDHLADHLATTRHGLTTAQVNERVTDVIERVEHLHRRLTTITAISAFAFGGALIAFIEVAVTR